MLQVFRVQWDQFLRWLKKASSKEERNQSKEGTPSLIRNLGVCKGISNNSTCRFLSTHPTHAGPLSALQNALLATRSPALSSVKSTLFPLRTSLVRSASGCLLSALHVNLRCHVLLEVLSDSQTQRDFWLTAASALILLLNTLHPWIICNYLLQSL